MTIRSLKEIGIDKGIERYSDRRCGFIQEDDIVFSIRNFHLISVNEETFTDPNTQATTTLKSISFSEHEREFEYWYSKYGVKFDGTALDFASSVNNTDDEHFDVGTEVANKANSFSYVRTVSLNMDEPYNDILHHCVNQSALASIPGVEDHVTDAFNFSIACQELSVDQEPV